MHTKPYHCFDCDGPTFLYSVHDHVWAKAWPDYPEEKAKALARNGEFAYGTVVKQRHPMNCLCLCTACLAKRLGRPLTLGDLDDTKANDPIRFGYTLKGPGLP